MAVNHLVVGSNPTWGANLNICSLNVLSGEMAEWLKATVLKTVVSQDTQGSNPCFSAIFFVLKLIRKGARVAERAPLLRE